MLPLPNSTDFDKCFWLCQVHFVHNDHSEQCVVVFGAQHHVCSPLTGFMHTWTLNMLPWANDTKCTSYRYRHEGCWSSESQICVRMLSSITAAVTVQPMTQFVWPASYRRVPTATSDEYHTHPITTMLWIMQCFNVIWNHTAAHKHKHGCTTNRLCSATQGVFKINLTPGLYW